MRKVIIGLALAILLSGCEPDIYTKGEGQVVGKDVSGGRGGSSYYIKVAYPLSDGKFTVGYFYLPKETYESYNVGDKVIVYGNKDGIGGVTKP